MYVLRNGPLSPLLHYTYLPAQHQADEFQPSIPPGMYQCHRYLYPTQELYVISMYVCMYTIMYACTVSHDNYKNNFKQTLYLWTVK